MTTRFFCIEIAGYPFGIEAPEPLWGALQETYLPFQSAREPRYRIRAAIDPAAQPVDLWEGMTLDNMTLSISDDTSRARFDFKTGEGLIRLNPARLLVPLGAFLRNIITLLLSLHDNGLLMHACGVLYEEEAYLFVGRSGAGKTTVSRALDYLPTISDDLLLVTPSPGGFGVWPHPRWGDRQSGSFQNRPYRINSIYLLCQDTGVFVKRLCPARAAAHLLTVPHVPVNRIPAARILENTQRLAETVPVYELHFRPDPSFWEKILEERERIVAAWK